MKIGNIFDIANSGMRTAKAGITIAGHNVANAQNPDYTRKSVRTESVVLATHGLAGNHCASSGVDVASIKRYSDDFLTAQVHHQSAEKNYQNTMQQSLLRLEQVFNELGDHGLHDSMSSFFNSFQALANEPQSFAIRELVRENATQLCQNFHRVYEKTQQCQTDIFKSLDAYCKDYNTICHDICGLNEAIQSLQADTKEGVGDLLDKRDAALGKLSELVAIKTYINEKNQLQAYIPGIGSIIHGNTFEPLEVHQSSAPGSYLLQSHMVMPSSTHKSIDQHLTPGCLKACLDVEHSILPKILEDLNTLAATLHTQVNTLHAQGVTMLDTQNVFFKPLEAYKGSGAALQLQLDESILEDVKNIATGYENNTPGDNRIALAIAHLGQSKLMQNATCTLKDFYTSIISDVGLKRSICHKNLEQHQDMLLQLEQLREQLSGVSIDEETTLLMQLEHVFGASARIIQIADEMLRTILSLGKS